MLMKKKNDKTTAGTTASSEYSNHKRRSHKSLITLFIVCVNQRYSCDGALTKLDAKATARLSLMRQDGQERRL